MSSLDGLGERVVVEVVELAALDRLGLDAQFLADRGGRHLVVAGDHLDGDPRGPAARDRLVGLGAGGIDDADHRLQVQVPDVD